MAWFERSQTASCGPVAGRGIVTCYVGSGGEIVQFQRGGLIGLGDGNHFVRVKELDPIQVSCTVGHERQLGTCATGKIQVCPGYKAGRYPEQLGARREFGSLACFHNGC